MQYRPVVSEDMPGIESASPVTSQLCSLADFACHLSKRAVPTSTYPAALGINGPASLEAGPEPR